MAVVLCITVCIRCRSYLNITKNQIINNLNRYKMDLIKTLTRYASYTLLALCGFAIWYFATAFVIMDLNPLNWSESTRFLVVAEGLVTAVGIVAITNLTISNQNY